MTAVTVVIGNYNGEHVLGECIASLREQTVAPRDILVVDGGSTDRSREMTAELGACLVADANEGLGRLYNRGAALADTEYVFFANNDIALLPTCLERLAGALDERPSAIAADARQLDWTGERTIHARTFLTRGSLVREHLPGLHLAHDIPSQTTAATVCANGAAMLVRRSMFEELGGFDRTFFMEWEDLDLCWRAWARGWATVYVPDAVVRHRVGAVTTDAIAPRRLASSHHNLLRFSLKCLPAAPAARVVLGELLRLPAHPRAIASAARQITVELAEIRRARKELRPDRSLFEALTAPQGVSEALR